jgi:hypothetical protein
VGGVHYPQLHSIIPKLYYEPLHRRDYLHSYSTSRELLRMRFVNLIRWNPALALCSYHHFGENQHFVLRNLDNHHHFDSSSNANLDVLSLVLLGLLIMRSNFIPLDVTGGTLTRIPVHALSRC